VKAASPVIVDLYRLAYNAGRPVTFDELVDGMPSAYQNDANRWWVVKEQAEGRDLPPEPWSASHLRSVKSKWLEEQVDSMVNTKRFSVDLKDGRPVRYKGRTSRSELLYSAVKEKRGRQGGPPMVEEDVIVRHVVPWTPEIGATGRRHVAGIKFRDEMARITALGSKASKHDFEEALQLAVEALSYGPSENKGASRARTSDG
jgi:hypothetical protein